MLEKRKTHIPGESKWVSLEEESEVSLVPPGV